MTAGLVCLYKIASLGFSYPVERNWKTLDEFLPAGVSLTEGHVRARAEDFESVFNANRHRIRDMESEYLRVFDTGGLISPCGTEHLRGKISRNPLELADIAGFYHAFGFAVGDEAGRREPVDHISLELEFMALLAFKEYHAVRSGQDEKLTLVREARKKFLHEHLAQRGFHYCRRIRELECEDYYKCLGAVLHSVLSEECEQSGLDASQYEKVSQDPKREERDEK